jgi:hypothetical protein
MAATALFDNYKNAFFILLNYRQRPTGRLQQSGEFSFDKAALLVRIANMAQWRAHIERAAQTTLGQHIVATQVHLRRFARGAQLLQMAVAEFVLLVPFVTDGLSIRDAFRHRR